jgi:hypothetical protein
MIKNEAARRNVLEFEARRKKEWAERKLEMEAREKALLQRRQEEREEREEKRKEEELRKAQRFAEVEHNHRAFLENKRRKTQEKQERQDMIIERMQTARKEELERQKFESEQRELAAKTLRDTTFEEQENQKRERFEKQEASRMNYYVSKQTSDDYKRRKNAAERKLRLEEGKMVSDIRANAQLTKNIEEQNSYEERVKAFQSRVALKRDMQLESQRKRNQLEQQKADLQAGLISPIELRKKGAGKLQTVANSLGIDLAPLLDQAKAYRRGRPTSRSESSSLPRVLAK